MKTEATEAALLFKALGTCDDRVTVHTGQGSTCAILPEPPGSLQEGGLKCRTGKAFNLMSLLHTLPTSH